MVLYKLTAQDAAGILGTTLLRPHDDLFTGIRSFADQAGIGKYKTFDEVPDSPTLHHHIFQRGIVKLSVVHV